MDSFKKLKFDIEDVLEAFNLQRNVENCEMLNLLLSIDATKPIERYDFLEQKTYITKNRR
jgi:hypothetical protein